MLNLEERLMLEGVINEEIYSYLDSGYSAKNEYVIMLINILKKLNLKEYYSYMYNKEEQK